MTSYRPRICRIGLLALTLGFSMVLACAQESQVGTETADTQDQKGAAPILSRVAIDQFAYVTEVSAPMRRSGAEKVDVFRLRPPSNTNKADMLALCSAMNMLVQGPSALPQKKSLIEADLYEDGKEANLSKVVMSEKEKLRADIEQGIMQIQEEIKSLLKTSNIPNMPPIELMSEDAVEKVGQLTDDLNFDKLANKIKYQVDGIYRLQQELDGETFLQFVYLGKKDEIISKKCVYLDKNNKKSGEIVELR